MGVNIISERLPGKVGPVHHPLKKRVDIQRHDAKLVGLPVPGTKGRGEVKVEGSNHIGVEKFKWPLKSGITSVSKKGKAYKETGGEKWHLATGKRGFKISPTSVVIEGVKKSSSGQERKNAAEFGNRAWGRWPKNALKDTYWLGGGNEKLVGMTR